MKHLFLTLPHTVKMLRKTLVLSAVAIILSLAAKALADGHVHALTADTFDSTLGTKPALVEFYAPWCGHCKNLEPVRHNILRANDIRFNMTYPHFIYAQLGEAYASKKDHVLIAKADADSERQLASRFGIRGYPTIKWFPEGIEQPPEDYNGGRDLESLSQFVAEKSGVRGTVKKVVSAVTVLTESDFDEKVLKSGKNVLVEFYAPWCGHCKNLAPTYEKLASDFVNEKDVIVAKVDATVEKALAAKYGVSGYPTIKYFSASSPSGTAPQEYSGGRSEQELVSFINKHAGTARAPGGKLLDSAGRITALDTIASQIALATTTPEEKKVLIEEGLKKANELSSTDKNAVHYVRVFEKTRESPDFIANESARLAKIIQSGTITPVKLDEFSVRHNIISAFVATPPPPPPAADDDDLERDEL
ncbi:hypothetical protein EC991_005116 [Linnemannia zychae]|nr:hypothetical protein EC991_005116 [Linnemannia zychae]